MNVINSLKQQAFTGDSSGLGANVHGTMSVAKASFSDYFNKLLSVKNKLEDRVRQSKNISSSLLVDTNIYGDIDTDLKTDDLPFVHISEDTATLFVDNLKGNTLVSASGYPCVFIDGNNQIYDGKTIIIKTQTTVYSLKDVFLYEEDDEYYINPNVRSQGFWDQSEHVYIPPLTIWENILEYIDFRSLNVESQTIQGALGEITGHSDWDIQRQAFHIAVNIEAIGTVSDTDSVLSLLQAINTHIGQVYHDNYGTTIWMADLARDIVKSSEINDCILDASDQLLHGSFNVSNFNSQWIDSDCTITFRDNVTHAYAIGGVIGAIKCILNYLSCFNGAQDNYGHLTLTDNNQFVGQEYIAGIILTVAGSVVSLIGMLLTLVSGPVGLAVSALGAVLTAVPQAINYDYRTATSASIRDADNHVCLPFSPLVSMHGHMPMSEITNSGFGSYIRGLGTENPITLLYVPGGAVLIGINPEHYDQINWEFHPGFINLDPTPMGLSSTPYSKVVQNTHYWDSWYPTDGENVNINYWSLMNAYYKGTPIDVSNNDDGVLNDDDDALLRGTIVRNAYVFKAFICLLTARFGTYAYENDLADFTGWNTGIPYEHNYPILPNGKKDYWSDEKYRVSLSLVSNPAWKLKPSEGIEFGSSYPFWINDLSWNNIITLFNDMCSDVVHFIGDNNFDVFWGIDVTKDVPLAPPDNVTESGNLFTYTQEHDYTLTIGQIIANKAYYGDNVPIDFDFEWGHLTPKYNKSTFILWTALAIATVVATTIVAVTVAVKWKKYKQNKQIQLAAETEAAWSDMTENGVTADKIKTYRRAVMKNNMFASISGGTKYAKSGFWNDVSSNDNGVKTSLFNKMTSSIAQSGYSDIEVNLDDVLRAIGNVQTSITGE